MVKYDLIPLYNLEAVFKAWPLISKDAEKVIEHSNDSDDLTRLLNDILSNRQLLWVGFEDGKYVGFITTSIRILGTSPPTKILWMGDCYVTPQTEVKTFPAFFHILEKYAAEQECQQIRFQSSRSGFEKLGPKFGFSPMFTEYGKDIKDG